MGRLANNPCVWPARVAHAPTIIYFSTRRVAFAFFPDDAKRFGSEIWTRRPTRPARSALPCVTSPAAPQPCIDSMQQRTASEQRRLLKSPFSSPFLTPCRGRRCVGAGFCRRSETGRSRAFTYPDSAHSCACMFCQIDRLSSLPFVGPKATSACELVSLRTLSASAVHCR